MTNRSFALFCGLLTLAGLTSCQRAPTAANGTLSQSTQSTPENASVNAATQPAQNMVMVCRNSQTGQKAECGTPNAVMVGMKPETRGNVASSGN
ncbi:MAG TPA: hypothetical protein VGF42_07060 [Caulobacteraceae bacterium]|jgi:hypothetical protein